MEDLASTRATRLRGEDAIELANSHMSVVVVPARGAKVVSLRDRVRDMEWLAPPIREWTTPSPGDWLGQDCGGWDECFPNVVAEPHPLTGQPLDDHGEVWSRPWSLEEGGHHQVVTTVLGIGLPFRLSRAMSLRANRLTCHYRLENLAEAPLVVNWLMHVLLEIVPLTRVTLPDGGGVRPDPDTGPFTRARSVVPGGRHSDLDRLPETRGPYENVDLLFDAKSTGAATKWLTTPHTASSCLVQRPDGALVVEVDPMQVPNFGLWINDGGWPEANPHRNLGLEAALGGFDRLSRAHREGSAIRLGGHHTKEWSVHLLTLSAEAGREVVSGRRADSTP